MPIAFSNMYVHSASIKKPFFTQLRWDKVGQKSHEYCLRIFLLIIQKKGLKYVKSNDVLYGQVFLFLNGIACFQVSLMLKVHHL